MSPTSIPWRYRWRVLTRPDALLLRLRHALTFGERLRERVRITFAAWQYRQNPQPVTVRFVRPANLHTGPPELEAHLDPRDGLSIRSVQLALQTSWPTTPDVLLILVRYRSPPLLVARTDTEVHSWAAAPEVRARIPGPDSPLLAMLDATLRLPDLGVQVVQVGALVTAASVKNPGAASIAWVVPHRGHAPWLGECLARLVPQLRSTQGDEALVGLDEVPNLTVRALRATFPMCWFGALRRPGVGPFVIRQRAIEQTTCDWLLFQDSDDLPTIDRAPRLLAEAQQRPTDALGSHELRLDYLTRRVLPVRFPLNASAALRVAMGHPALFPTLLVRRASLLAVGGFSTYLRFALDTQLLLRASFTWQMQNVDAFLYLRRRRAGSLTTDPATALGSPAREQHRARWRADFAAVQAGALPLSASSLTAQRGAEYQQNELEPL